MLKVLAKEGKVLPETVCIGKKRKVVFSITQAGREEFKAWFESPTGAETPRNEFLLKLFFVSDRKEMSRIFQERLEKVEEIHEEYNKIEKRLKDIPDSSEKATRLKALSYGMALLESEMQWLNAEKGG
jgi:DNA-binding PadR family transcriptional regulator